MPVIAIALVIAAALGGGTAFAAQSSLPGDALWNFKTAVNENVEGLFAQDDQAKADLDIKLAAQRLNEAQQLASQGALSTQADADLETNFSAHAKDVSGLVAKLQADGKASVAAQIAAQWQSQVAQHAADIRINATTTAQASIAPLLTTLRTTLDDAATLSAETYTQSNSNATVQGLQVSNDTVEATSSGASASSDSNADAGTGGGVQVHAGTSVRGGAGGIQTTEDGSVIGI